MNIEQARFNMVEQQIRPWEVLDQGVLDLLFVIKREEFVPPAYKALAFADLEIPLGVSGDAGAIMLQPKVEARILQEIQLRKSDRVLEIGAGSGYMAALLGAKSDHVYSIEIVPELARLAQDNLRRADIHNVTVELGDAARGWAAHAPYDVIVLSGSTPVLPAAFLQQLKLGGRLFAVVGEPPVMEAQLIRAVGEGSFQTVNLFETNIPALQNAETRPRFVF